MIRRACIVICFMSISWACCHSTANAQTARGDILRGAGAFAEGVGWYNLRTAKSNAINVQAMRNYNQEVRLNYANRVQFWAQKGDARKLTKEQAAKRAAERLQQLRDNPTTEDIRSGDALNMLAVMLTDPDVNDKSWYVSSMELPEQATVKDIVFQYYPNKMTDKDVKIDVALSRLNKNVDWPLVFTADSFSDERAAYENAVSKVRSNVVFGKVDLDDFKSLQNSLDRLQTEITNTYAGDRSGYALKSKEFYGKLKSATKLFDGDVVDYAQELLRETEEYDARTVGELVGFMLKYRLFFAEAETPRSIELYHQLFSVLDKQARQLGASVPTIDDSLLKDPVVTDQFPVGTVLQGQAVLVVNGKKRHTPIFTLEVTKRSGTDFEGRLTMGEPLTVSGKMPTKGNGEVTFGASRIGFKGIVNSNGVMTLDFAGQGPKGNRLRGRVELSAK